MKIIEIGSGRRSTVYAFDFAYCIFKDVPTHYIRDSERIDKSRNLEDGEWIGRVTNITSELIDHSKIIGKIDGEIVYYDSETKNGFIQGDDKNRYFMQFDDIIHSDRLQRIHVNKRVRFIPNILENLKVARDIEIL